MISAVNKYSQRRQTKAAPWSHVKEGNKKMFDFIVCSVASAG